MKAKQYSDYLVVRADRSIWWRLIDATKLGAGFVPDKDGISLVATKPEQIVRQRNLLARFVPGRISPGLPNTAAHGGHRYVEAQEFLVWLRRLFDDEEPGSMAFPGELALAVQNAIERDKLTAAQNKVYVSLVATLEPWIEAARADLPDAVWREIEHEVFLSDWDALAPEQRRSLALQLDNQRDSAKAGERKYWWDYGVRRYELESRIAKWETASGDSVTDLVARERALADLRKQLASLDVAADQYEKVTQRAALDRSASVTSGTGKQGYVPYLRALAVWSERFDATPEEVAAWVYFGPDAGGLAAFLNANELDPPPRFFYGTAFLPQEKDWDYVAPLMSCWFRQEDVESFEPTDRYVTGETLKAQWANVPGIRFEAFVAAKARESTLMDVHPIMNATQATEVGNDAYPPASSALFLLAHVERIEIEEFGWSRTTLPASLSKVSAVSAEAIAAAFRVLRDEHKNRKWWRDRMADAARTKLDACRVGPARHGRGPGTLWRPDLVAAWLTDRKPEHRGGMPASAIRRGLLEFADCHEVADLMFPSDS